MDDNIKISELPVCTHVNEQCCLPIVSEGETKRIEYGTLRELLNKDIAPKWDNIDGKPNEFTPEEHTHKITDIKNLESILEDKQDSLTAGANIKIKNNVISADLSKVQEELTELRNNQLIISVTGSDIHITDSAKAKMRKFIVNGKTEQETRSGKNLLKPLTESKTSNGVTLTYDNETGEYTLNGTATSSTNFDISTFTLESNTYTLQAGNTIIPVDNNAALIQVISASQNKYPQISNNDGIGTSKTFELPASSDYRFRIRIQGEVTYDNFKLKPQLEIGSTKTDFEIYGASPSPDYPAEISVVEKNLEVNLTGGNVLDLTKGSFGSCQLNSDGKSITSKITNNYFCNIATTDLNDFLLAHKGEKITFSTGTPIADKTTSIVITGVRGGVNSNQEVSETGTGKCSVTIASEFTSISQIQLRFNRKSTAFTDTTTTIDYAMLELGDGTDEYEPYQSSSKTYDIGDEFMAEQDYIEGNKLNKKIGKLVLDGSEDWELQWNDKGYAYRTPTISDLKISSNNNEQGNLWCNYFVSSSVAQAYNLENGNYKVLRRTNYQNIVIRNDDYTTVSQFKAWLAEQYANDTPVIIYYELAEPYQVDISSDGELKTYKTVTNISNDANSNMNVTYVQDLQTVINNLTNSIVNNAAEEV